MKTKLLANFNGTKEGLTISVKADPNKEIFVTMLAKVGNIYNYFTGFAITSENYYIQGPNWNRQWKLLAYEWIDGKMTLVDEVNFNPYGSNINFYLQEGESLETHFSWAVSIQEYCEKFNCKGHIESEYAEIIEKSFSNLSFYKEMNSVTLKSTHLGFHIVKDFTFTDRTDYMPHRSDIQYYSWWNPRPPHNLTDKEIIHDIIYGPDYNDPMLRLNLEPQEMVGILSLLDQ
jgi:hypothetical protein